MTTGLLLQNTLHSEPVTIRALSSITTHQIDTIMLALTTGREVWDVRVENDYDGYCMILIAPGTGNAARASFFVSGTAIRLELYQTEKDDLVLLGTFADVTLLLARLLEITG